MRNKKPLSANRTDHMLRTCNNILSVIVLLLAVYIVGTPFLPHAQYVVDGLTGKGHAVSASAQVVPGEAESEPMPDQNTLVVPSLALREIIHEGQTASALRQGVWRRPHTSIPPKDSNTVLAGHRFTYSNPKGVFYHLDKVNQGDSIVLYWEGKKHSYQVSNIKVVKPSAIEVEQPSDTPMLTLYTCTPLWSGKERLVVQAVLIEAQ